MKESDNDGSASASERDEQREAMPDNGFSRGGQEHSAAPLPFAKSCLARERTTKPDRIAECGPREITLSAATLCIRPLPRSLPSFSSFSPSTSPPPPPPPSQPSPDPRQHSRHPSSRTNSCHIANLDMVVATLSPVCSQSPTPKSPKYPFSHSPSPSVLSSSIQTVRYASEQGRRLAHRSRTSINRLLDCVIDNAAAFAESGSWHGRYSDIDHRIPFTIHSSMDAPGLPDVTTSSQGPPMTSRGPKPKFFVCDDDDSDEEYEEEQLDWASRGSFRFPSVAPCGGGIDHLDSDIDIDDDGQDRNTDDGAPLKKYQAFPHISQFSPANGIRRQSLLSDMLLAEKLMATQGAASRRPTDSTTSSWASTMLSSNGTSRCPSSTNSDGEMSHSGVPAGRHLYRSPRSTVQPPPQTLAGLAHQSIQSNQRQGDRSFTHSRNKESGLRRTKKSMFKNLDELVEKTEQTSCSSLPPISTCQFAMSPTCRAVSEATFTGSTSQPEIASAPSSPSSSPSPLKSSSKKHNLPTLPSTINTCCRTPATATTTTAFATATSKCTTSASSASAATAAAAAAGSSSGGTISGWTRIPPVQAQVHSLYGQLTSAIQRAIS